MMRTCSSDVVVGNATNVPVVPHPDPENPNRSPQRCSTVHRGASVCHSERIHVQYRRQSTGDRHVVFRIDPHPASGPRSGWLAWPRSDGVDSLRPLNFISPTSPLLGDTCRSLWTVRAGSCSGRCLCCRRNLKLSTGKRNCVAIRDHLDTIPWPRCAVNGRRASPPV